MKTEELEALGLNEDQIKSVFAMNGKDVNAAKGELEKITGERDAYKTRAETAESGLAKFGDHKPEDIETYSAEIQKLNQQIADQKAEYEKQNAEREFSNALSDAITKSGGKNAKAIAALMDLEALRGSKNQREDIEKAIEAVKAENDYLFDSDEPIKNPVAKTNGKKSEDSAARRAAARRALGLPDEEDKK